MVRFEEFVPAILHDLSDRNRTSPVAFTGNKFEFRMPGSSASLAFPISVINLLVCRRFDGSIQGHREDPGRKDVDPQTAAYHQ